MLTHIARLFGKKSPDKNPEPAALRHQARIPPYKALVAAGEDVTRFSNNQILWSENGAFVQAMPRENIGKPPIEENIGWKVHLSIDKNDVEKAFDLIAPILAEANVYAFKVTKNATLEQFAQEGSQQGKQITIYFDHCNRPVEDVLHDIEEILVENGIRPGLPVKGDRPIDGSIYQYKRCDRDMQGNYVPASEIQERINEGRLKATQAYNPCNKQDIFENIDLSDIHQTSAAIRRLKETYASNPLPKPRTTYDNVADMIRGTTPQLPETSKQNTRLFAGEESLPLLHGASTQAAQLLPSIPESIQRLDRIADRLIENAEKQPFAVIQDKDLEEFANAIAEASQNGNDELTMEILGNMPCNLRRELHEGIMYDLQDPPEKSLELLQKTATATAPIEIEAGSSFINDTMSIQEAKNSIQEARNYCRIFMSGNMHQHNY